MPIGSELQHWLTQALAQQASDLHLLSGHPARIRVHGVLRRLHSNSSPSETLNHDSLQTLLLSVMPEPLHERFLHQQEVDFAFTLEEHGRFRANAFSHHDGCGVVLRHLPNTISQLKELHTPEVLTHLLEQVGLLLVCGPTGSGKSTTMAAMVQHLNRHTQQHIITLEDPIEFVHTSVLCQITQRQIGSHSKSFSQALRAALREDPDVLLVGEMRDMETIRLALSAAETGHLVLASLHTRSAAASVERIIDVFERHEKSLIRLQPSQSLVGVLSQQLVVQDHARRAVFETLVATPAVRHLIREGKTSQIQNAMQTGAAHGMHTMAQAIQQAILPSDRQSHLARL